MRDIEVTSEPSAFHLAYRNVQMNEFYSLYDDVGVP